MMENHTSYYRFLAVVLIASSSLLTSCFSPKNLVTKQHSTPDYDFVGDTLDGWALVRQDSLWGYVSANGKRTIKPGFQWATDFNDGMTLVQDEHGYRYLNNQGKLIRRVKAQHAYSFAEGLAPVEIKGKWGFINRKGKKAIKTQFDWAEPFQEGRAAVAIGLKKGYINKDGELIIPAIYEEAHPFSNGVAIVRKDLKWGMIDTLGNFLLPNQYDQIEPWETDFYRLGVYNPAADRVNIFGLADVSGKLLLDTQYAAIKLIQDRYIHARRDTLVGLWDRYGNVVIPMEYTSFGVISDDGVLAAYKNGKAGFINLQNQIVLPIEYEGTGTSGNRKIAYKDSTYVLMDNQFKVIKRIKNYKDVYSFSNGFAVVSIKDPNDYYGNLYGYIDEDGNEIIPPKYPAAGAVNAYGIMVVGQRNYSIIRQLLINTHDQLLSEGEDYYEINAFGSRLLYNKGGSDFKFFSSKTGQVLTNFPYTKLYPLEYGERKDWAKVYRNGKIGLIDTTLTELLPPEYDDMRSFYKGRIEIKKGDHWGYADEQFRIRIPFIYNKTEYFRYAMTTVEQNKKKGLIDRDGRTVIPLRYDQITFDYACDRIYADKGDDGIDIYDREGRLLLATDFEYIGQYGSNNYVAYRQNGKLGFMDYDFKVLYEPEFNGCGHFYDGLAWVRKDAKGGYINKQFQLVVPVELEYMENFAAGFTKVKKDGREYYINTKGEEVVPTEAELKKRNEEIERRKRGWIDFSS